MVHRCGLGRLNTVRLSATLRDARYAHQVGRRVEAFARGTSVISLLQMVARC